MKSRSSRFKNSTKRAFIRQPTQSTLGTESLTSLTQLSCSSSLFLRQVRLKCWIQEWSLTSISGCRLVTPRTTSKASLMFWRASIRGWDMRERTSLRIRRFIQSTIRAKSTNRTGLTRLPRLMTIRRSWTEPRRTPKGLIWRSSWSMCRLIRPRRWSWWRMLSILRGCERSSF